MLWSATNIMDVALCQIRYIVVIILEYIYILESCQYSHDQIWQQQYILHSYSQ